MPSLNEIRNQARERRLAREQSVNGSSSTSTRTLPVIKEKMQPIATASKNDVVSPVQPEIEEKVVSLRQYMASRRAERAQSITARDSASQVSIRTGITEAQVMDALDATKSEVRTLAEDNDKLHKELAELKDMVHKLRTS